MSKSIYQIEVLFATKDNNVSFKEIERSRDWGYYFDIAHAIYSVMNNVTDIYENFYYNYVLVKEVPPGIAGFSDGKVWVLKVNYNHLDNGCVEFSHVNWHPNFFCKEENFLEQETKHELMSTVSEIIPAELAKKISDDRGISELINFQKITEGECLRSGLGRRSLGKIKKVYNKYNLKFKE